MPASVLSPDEHFHDQTVVDALARLSAGLLSTAHLPQLPSRAPNGLRSGPRREERKYSTYLNDEQRRDATQMRDFTTGVNPFGAPSTSSGSSRQYETPCQNSMREPGTRSQPRFPTAPDRWRCWRFPEDPSPRGAHFPFPAGGARPISVGAAIFQVKIVLLDIEPAIWRRVLVPADTTLDRLHDLSQAAFGWENYHLHVLL